MRHRKIFGTIWAGYALLLFFLFLLYASLQIREDPYAVVIPVALLLLFWMLNVLEGAEVATTSLMDKDPDQLTDPRARTTLSRLRDNASINFLLGRQALAVAAIVLVTLISGVFATVKVPSGLDLGWVQFTWVKFLFVFSLSNFIVLWFCQVSPKLFAHEDPVREFSGAFSQWFIAGAISLDRISNIGAPGRYSRSVVDQIMHHDRSSRITLLPSRKELYETSATLHFGRGLEEIQKIVTIHSDGSVHVCTHFEYKGYGHGFEHLEQGDRWTGTISDVHIIAVSVPDDSSLGIDGPILGDAQINPRDPAIAHGAVSWKLNAPRRVHSGESLSYRVDYDVGRGATPCIAGASDWLGQNVRMPTRQVVFEVHRAVGFDNVVLQNPRCIVTEPKVDPAELAKEAGRATIKPLDRGYRFEFSYPLEGTDVEFHWDLARRV